MIIRRQCLLNNCRIPAFPRRIQIKPAENNLATTPQAFCGRRGYMALRGNTFYPWGDGPRNLGQGPGMPMQEERTQSMRRWRALPRSRRGSSLLPPALSAWGGCPSPKQDDFISSGMRPSVLGHRSYLHLLHSGK